MVSMAGARGLDTLTRDGGPAGDTVGRGGPGAPAKVWEQDKAKGRKAGVRRTRGWPVTLQMMTTVVMHVSTWRSEPGEGRSHRRTEHFPPQLSWVSSGPKDPPVGRLRPGRLEVGQDPLQQHKQDTALGRGQGPGSRDAPRSWLSQPRPRTAVEGRRVHAAAVLPGNLQTAGL